MKVAQLLESSKDEDDEFPDLKDLSKHIYTIILTVDERVINNVSDAAFNRLVTGIENSEIDDFIVWHRWEEAGISSYYVFDVAGTLGFQELANVTKKIREVLKLPASRVGFTIKQGRSTSHTKTAGEVNVTL